MPLIFKVQVHKGHATCSKCGKFVSKKLLNNTDYALIVLKDYETISRQANETSIL